MMSSQEAGAVVTGNLYRCTYPLILIFLFKFISCAVIDMIFFYVFHAQHFFVASESSELG